MGLRDKASRYSKKAKLQIEVEDDSRLSLEFDVYNFIIELLNDEKPDLLVKTILLSFMSRFNVNKVLINFLNEKTNVYHLLGYKGK